MNEFKYQSRKHPRLKNYDYSQNGCYFVTLCTKGRANILGKLSVGRDVFVPPNMELSEYGVIIDLLIRQLPVHYKSIMIPKYVVMPNHVHILINIESASGGLKTARPTHISVL